jgi:putative transposase
MKTLEYIRDEHRVHLIVYHLIWCTKRRKSVLVNKIKEDCEKLIRDKCEQNAWQVIELAIQPDHVHLFVRSFPTINPYTIIKECKGIASFELRKKYKELKTLPCLWTRTYFASTAGNVSSEIIRKYIEAQDTK